MRPLKLVLAALIGLLAIAAVFTGFVFVAALGAVVLLILGLRRLITGKPMASVRFERVSPAPARPARPHAAEGVIDIEATPVKKPAKTLEP